MSVEIMRCERCRGDCNFIYKDSDYDNICRKCKEKMHRHKWEHHLCLECMIKELQKYAGSE